MNQHAIGGYAVPQDAVAQKRAYEESGLVGANAIRKDLHICEELAQLESALKELEAAQSQLANALMPVLFFGAECATAPQEESPPGSDIARDLYNKKMQILRCAAFIRNIHSKVNL